METSKIVAILDREQNHMADLLVHGDLGRNDQKVTMIALLVKNLMQGNEGFSIDLGMNSHYAHSNGNTTIRFVSPDKGGVSQPLLTIVPKQGFEEKVNPELGMKIAAAFVRDETPYVPAPPATRAGRGAPSP